MFIFVNFMHKPLFIMRLNGFKYILPAGFGTVFAI